MHQKKMTFKDWIKKVGIKEVAKQIGVNESTVGHWRTGRALPTFAHMQKINEVSKGQMDFQTIVGTRQNHVTWKQAAR